MLYKVAINTQVCNEKTAMISIADRGFRFGDGIFDTMLFHNGKIFNLDFHLRRIKQGIESLKLKVDMEIREVLADFCKDLSATGMVRVAITRGEGSIGYLPTSKKANIVCEFTAKDLPNNSQGLQLMISQYRKIPAICMPGGIKTMQGLNSTMAILEAQENGFDDALQLTVDGLVCECSSANIFVRKAGDIYTPPVVDGPLQGSIRHLIVHELKVAKERSMKIEDLSEADEVFITSVGRVVQSVSSIHGIANYYSKQSAGSILNHIYGLLNE